MVFVADSQIERMEANLESVENLRINLAEQGYALDKTPVRHPVQQARPAQRRAARRAASAAQPDRRARLRGVRDRRQGRVRDAQGRRALGAARSQADERLALARHSRDHGRRAPFARSRLSDAAPPALASFPARAGAVWSPDCCGRPIVREEPEAPETRASGRGWVIVSGILDERGLGHRAGRARRGCPRACSTPLRSPRSTAGAMRRRRPRPRRGAKCASSCASSAAAPRPAPPSESAVAVAAAAAVWLLTGTAAA